MIIFREIMKISQSLPMQMVGGIVKEGVILANEFASNNERRWFGLHYHGSFLIHYLLPTNEKRFYL